MQPLEIEEGGASIPPPPPRRQLTAVEEEWKLKKDANDQESCASRVNWKRFALFIFALVVIVAVLATVLSVLKKHHVEPTEEDSYAIALRKALLFFDGQMSGKLPNDERFPWRVSSGKGLVGGFYDAGNNMKLTFPMAFSISMLSWSVLEYGHKYKAMGEYDHVRDIIKWGTDYLLLTFDPSVPYIDHIVSEMAVEKNYILNTSTPEELYCWQRPEDIEHEQRAVQTFSGPDLAGEMVAALASASLVFRDDPRYYQKLVKGAKVLLNFANDSSRQRSYSDDENISNPKSYNSTGYYDEDIWASIWMYYTTGESKYLSIATSPSLSELSKAFSDTADLRVLGWDNKLPAAELLLTRLWMFLSSPGYPIEEMLRRYQNTTERNMCSFLERFKVFNFTRGGLIELKRPRPLQYVANAAFASSVYADYLDAIHYYGWNCGDSFIDLETLRQFATSQVDYILGVNPMNMSYLVGYGTKFPTHVHHRAASIPRDGTTYSCTGGWKWRDTPSPNPYNITGAMVGGPDRNDIFYDVRTDSDYTEPSLAGNAGLVSALVSLTRAGGKGIDVNAIFPAIPPF